MTDLTAEVVEAFLRQFEPLQHVVVEEESFLIPWRVKLHGLVSIRGEVHAFETFLDLNDFKDTRDLEKLAGQLIKSFEQASRSTA